MPSEMVVCCSCQDPDAEDGMGVMMECKKMDGTDYECPVCNRVIRVYMRPKKVVGQMPSEDKPRCFGYVYSNPENLKLKFGIDTSNCPNCPRSIGMSEGVLMSDDGKNCENCVTRLEWFIHVIGGKPWPTYPVRCHDCSRSPLVYDNWQLRK